MAVSVGWKKVATFFVIACAWSWPFFWLRDMNSDAWLALGVPGPLKNTLLMWGPGISALICFRLFGGAHNRAVTFSGGSALYSAAFYCLPFFALGIVGITNPESSTEKAHLIVLAIAVMGFINILGEELGWRGFLQDSLVNMGKAGKYILIGTLWTIWHFTNIIAGRTPLEIAKYLAWYLPITIILSALIGESTDRTRSLVVAVTLHSWVNIIFEFGGGSTSAVLCGSAILWVWLLYKWPSRQQVA